MKIKYLAKLCLLFCFISIPTKSFAYLLEEQEISTKDKSCSIRYLTEKNVKGWFISADHISCTEDGWLSGYHELTINNAFSQPVEKLYGYFSYGYWTAGAYIKTPFLTRFSENVGVQKATYLLAKDDQLQMDYIGQMTATKNSKGQYSEFQVCNPFKLLIVTDQIPAFANKRKQQIIFRNIKKHVRSVCPTEDKVLLFVSPVIEPQQEDIVFYSELDLKNHKSKNVWREEALKQAGFYDETLEAANLNDLIPPSEQNLDTLRQALSKKIDLIPFKNISNKKYPTQFEEINNTNIFVEPNISNKTSFIEPTTVSNNISLDADNELYIEKKETVLFDESENIPHHRNVDFNEEPKKEVYRFPKPNKTYKHMENKKKQDEPIAHLALLSKVKKEPVEITTVVHVNVSNHKEVLTNEPFVFALKGKRLQTGWHKISGQLDANNPPKGTKGIIQVKSATGCSDKQCLEEK